MVRVSLFLGVLLFSFPVFSDTKQKCGSNKHWVDSHFRRSYTRYDGTRVKATQVEGHCRKNPRGYEKWHQKLSNKRPKIWGYTKEKSKKWTIEEVHRLYEAISVLPDQIFDIDDIRIHRMFRSQNGLNPATTSPPEKVVTLYDLAFVHEDSLAQILSHELSHVLYESLTPEEFKKQSLTG